MAVHIVLQLVTPHLSNAWAAECGGRRAELPVSASECYATESNSNVHGSTAVGAAEAGEV